MAIITFTYLRPSFYSVPVAKQTLKIHESTSSDMQSENPNKVNSESFVKMRGTFQTFIGSGCRFIGSELDQM